MKKDSGTANKGKELTYELAPSEHPSEAIVKTVAEATDCNVIESTGGDKSNVLDPLYKTVDPEALDSLFQSTARGDERLGQVSFRYNGCEIEVHSSDFVKVKQIEKHENK
jgi:hypothetical protein